MKSVLISIRPEWCEKIASGEKTMEVRKTAPKLEPPFKVYVYQTKHREHTGPTYSDGKVIGEFVCDAIMSHCEMANADMAEYQGRIKREKLFEYANGRELFGWHISDLVIYETPKKLGEFAKPDKCPYNIKDECTYTRHCYRAGQTKRCGDYLERPPQSWCYVEEVKA